MKRYLVTGVALLTLLFLTVSAVRYTRAEDPTPGVGGPAGAATPTTTGDWTQKFDRFRGAQVTMADEITGNVITWHVTPGVISTVTGNSIIITPNGQTTTSSFGITSTTYIHAMPDPGSLTALKSGDRVVVITKGDSPDAHAIAKAGMMKGHFGMMHGFGGMMDKSRMSGGTATP